MERAFALANHWHAGHMRKGTEIPYISHLMAVSALVLEYGGTTTQASAALLHDVIEDTDCTIDEIIELVGNDVAQIVWECTHVEFPPPQRPASTQLTGISIVAPAGTRMLTFTVRV